MLECAFYLVDKEHGTDALCVCVCVCVFVCVCFGCLRHPATAVYVQNHRRSGIKFSARGIVKTNIDNM